MKCPWKLAVKSTPPLTLKLKDDKQNPAIEIWESDLLLTCDKTNANTNENDYHIAYLEVVKINHHFSAFSWKDDFKNDLTFDGYTVTHWLELEKIESPSNAEWFDATDNESHVHFPWEKL